MASFVDIPLKLIKPDFDSALLDIIIKLDYLRKIRLVGTTPVHVFHQIKSIFHLLESIESARIEGNRTTIAEYVDTRIEKKDSTEESIWELDNIQRAMEFAEAQMIPGGEITHTMVREIHRIIVDGLKREGDQNPGAYREKNVQIAGSDHLPPEWTNVHGYMTELLDFLNQESQPKYDLLKVAIAHHRFTWVHPFSNGNGRVVRIITYLLLIKYGFKPQAGGRILNPTAVFCNNREQYYEMLSLADTGTDDGYEQWCAYMLSGMVEELERVDKLTDYEFLKEEILLPSLTFCLDRKIITVLEKKILTLAVNEREFKASDLEKVLPDMDSRQRTYQIKKLIDSRMISPVKENARTYIIQFNDSELIRGVMNSLREQGFTSSLDS